MPLAVYLEPSRWGLTQPIAWNDARARARERESIEKRRRKREVRPCLDHSARDPLRVVIHLPETRHGRGTGDATGRTWMAHRTRRSPALGLGRCRASAVISAVTSTVSMHMRRHMRFGGTSVAGVRGAVRSHPWIISMASASFGQISERLWYVY